LYRKNLLRKVVEEKRGTYPLTLNVNYLLALVSGIRLRFVVQSIHVGIVY